MLQESISTTKLKFLSRISDLMQHLMDVHDESKTQETGPLIVVFSEGSAIHSETEKLILILF